MLPRSPSRPRAHLAADLSERFGAQMGRLVGPDFPSEMSLAVSGGGDSMAMLFLAAPWARVMGISLDVLTVDHGLRDVSAELSLVGKAAEELGLAHDVLSWRWDGAGNLSEAARDGRYAAMAERTKVLLVAHTQDDVAETFLMRLARGSGVDGLSAMAGRIERSGMTLLRPLLTTTREELRHYLRVLHIDHAEDPSNDDPRFERVKMRQALPMLAELGLSTARLAETAGRLGRAREVLSQTALAAHEAALAADPAPMLFDVVYDRDIFAQLQRETQLRLLAAALQYVSLEAHRPRLAALEETLDRALSGGASTLHGCYVYPHRDKLYVCAELSRVPADDVGEMGWRGLYDAGPNLIRTLGEKGAAQLRDQTDLPARVLWPCPAVWQGDRVISCPRIGQNELWYPKPDLARFSGLLTSR